MNAARVPVANEALQDWFEVNVPGARGPVVLDKFSGGQSNPTFRASSDTGRQGAGRLADKP